MHINDQLLLLMIAEIIAWSLRWNAFESRTHLTNCLYSALVISRKEKGQIVIQGEVNLTDIKGNKIPHGERFTLCGCAKSKNLPFCDGSHKLED